MTSTATDAGCPAGAGDPQNCSQQRRAAGVQAALLLCGIPAEPCMMRAVFLRRALRAGGAMSAPPGGAHHRQLRFDDARKDVPPGRRAHKLLAYAFTHIVVGL